jgi:hypothetical protein
MHTAVNRSLAPAWWNHGVAHDLQRVILYPYQFSSFNPGDPNETKWPADDDQPFVQCCLIANRIMSGIDIDNTSGATNYFDHSIEWPTAWGSQDDWIETIDLGAFRFFKLRPVTGSYHDEVQDASTEEN